MRRFGTATILGGLLLLGAGGSLSASDTPKAPGHARRKAMASKTTSSADVKLENLYVDAEIGQVFTVNLGKADQQAAAGESVASLGSVQVYQVGGSEVEPPATDPADPADSSDSMAPADPADPDEAAPAQEMAPADGDPAMAPAEGDPGDEPAAEPAAAPETDPAPAAQPNPGAAKPPAAKEAPKTPPPAAAAQAPPPPPPPIR
jgi:hypothetical protein